MRHVTAVRIALCSPYELGRVSGISVFVRELREGLRRKRHFVETFTPSEAAWILRLPAGLRTAAFSGWTFWSITSADDGWAVIHANQPHLQSVAALAAARIVGARYLVTYHSELPPAERRISGFGQAWANRVLGRFADTRVFVSNATKEALGRPGDAVIPIGIDPRLIESGKGHHELPGGREFAFLFVGRQTQSKGLFDLLEATRRLSSGRTSRAFRLHLVGDVPAKDARDRERRLRELGPVVEDHGVIQDRGALFTIMRESDVLVLPSYHEGLPLVLLEAMCLGCVPIASRVGGIPEVIRDRETGLLVEPGDREGLVDAMVWAVQHRDELREIAERARAQVLERFSFAETENRYQALYGTA